MQRRPTVRSARRAALACNILLAFLSIGLPVDAADAAKPAADDWYEGAPPDGSFHVRAPAPFQPFGVRDAVQTDNKIHTQGVRATQPGAFDAVTKWIASCVVDPDDRRKDVVRVEETLMRWQKQADFEYRRPVSVAKVSGVEFQMSDPNKTLRVRVFPGPDRVCTLLVQWNPYAKPKDEDVDRFFTSFAFAKR
jgi:hypothetical protein